MNPSFIHLRLHTEYSLSDGLTNIDELVQSAAKLGMPAVAVTDQMNLFAAIKFYQAALAAGIKPILGADCYLLNPAQPKQPFRFTLLCQNVQGYQNLTRLITRAFLEGQTHGAPMLQKSWLDGASTGLIALSGGREGEIGQTLLSNKPEGAALLLEEWHTRFPQRFYLELQRTGRANEEPYIQSVVSLAHTQQIPVVATNDVRFLRADDFEAHEARVCIHDSYVLDDPRRPKNYSLQQYLRSPAEMQTLFADLPEALINSVEIAKRCNLELTLGQTCLPNFPIPVGMTAEEFLTEQAEAGFKDRFIKKNPETLAPYVERLKTELGVINSMGFAGYFLIVADFIRWAKANQIPVGPGRGSGAGSLVAYVLLITDLDPLQYDLLFERFLNPERISMPDFDIDFCMEGRDRVIEYVAQRYGREAVSQIITFGSMAARAVVRDVGRVLGYPYGMVDKLAKLIPFELGITLEKALEQEEELKRRYDEEDEIHVLIDLARRLEGIARNAGKHAGGVVIAPSRLTDFTALYCEAGDYHCVTQFDKDDIETVGLVKFDFLGLRTLTIIDWTLRTINTKRKELGEPALNIAEIPLDDPATFVLLKACRTTAVFQFESRGMKDLIKRLQPDCFDELIALGALFRPGPLQSGMVDDFINRKHGRAKADYFHDSLEPILKPTYGTIVYQEQVLQIARVLAGYTLGSADILRKAMGKKKPEEMAKQREIFIAGAQAREVKGELAASIFDLMEKFAGYGFNKSHSTAYALVSYQTAWLKAHYPAEFMAAVLSSDMDHTDKVVNFLDECKHMKLKVLSPNINQSVYKFTVSETGEIIYGLGAIKGVGEAAIEGVLLNRKQRGKFKDLFDFCLRIDTQKVNKRTFEALLRSGALDELGLNRASLMATLDSALQIAEQTARSAARGQRDLFGYSAEPQHRAANLPEWSMEQRLQYEKETLGYYLSAHPTQRYAKELQHFITAPLAELDTHTSQSVTIAGWVMGLRVLFTKRGDRMAIVTLEDRSGRLDVTIFSEVFNTYKDLLVKDRLLILEGELSTDDYTGGLKVLARKIFSITQAREQFAESLIFKINANKTDAVLPERLRATIAPFCPGLLPIFIEYQSDDATALLATGVNWQVQPRDELLQAVQQILGENEVVVNYK